MPDAAKLMAMIGLCLVLVPQVPAAQGKNRFHEASEALVEAAYEALDAEKNWQALELFERAVVANPRNIPAYIGLGKTHQALGSISGALKYFAIALELDPLELAAWEAKIAAHLRIDELGPAEEALGRMRAVCGERACPEAERASAAIEAYKAKAVADAG